MANLISLGLHDDDFLRRPPKPAPPSAASSLSGVFRALAKLSHDERIDPTAELERGARLLADAEMEVLSAMCGEGDKARMLAELVEIKASAGQKTDATLQSALSTAESITDDIGAAEALLALARAERAAGAARPPSINAAKARIRERLSAPAARVRAEIALFEHECGGDPGSTFKAAKQILEQTSSGELAAALGAVAVREAQAGLDPDTTFQRAFFALGGEDDARSRRAAEAALSVQLAEAGRWTRAQELLGKLAQEDDAATASAMGGMAAAMVRMARPDVMRFLDGLPAAAPNSIRVAALARAVAALALADRFDEAKKLLARAEKIVEHAPALSLLGKLDDDAARELAIAQASLGHLDTARATAAQAGQQEPRAQLEVALAAARVGAKLLSDARRRSGR